MERYLGVDLHRTQFTGVHTTGEPQDVSAAVAESNAVVTSMKSRGAD
jgi:hypothetical protein